MRYRKNVLFENWHFSLPERTGGNAPHRARLLYTFRYRDASPSKRAWTVVRALFVWDKGCGREAGQAEAEKERGSVVKSLLFRWFVVCLLFSEVAIFRGRALQDLSDQGLPVFSSWTGLAEDYETFRDNNYPLVVPGNDVLSYGTWESVLSDIGLFSCTKWFWYFSEGTVRLDDLLFNVAGFSEKIPFIIYEDIYTAELIVAVQISTQTFREVYSQPVESYLSALNRGEELWEETARRRVVLYGELVSENWVDEAEPMYLGRSMALSEESSGVMLLRDGDYSSTNMWISIERAGTNESTDCLLTVHVPESITNSVDLFQKDDLLDPSTWALAAARIEQNEAHCAVWTNTVQTVERRFFSAADALVDTDGDSISDGRERFVYLTSVHTSDTDDDGISDDQELFAIHTDPNNEDISAPDVQMIVYLPGINPVP